MNDLHYYLQLKFDLCARAINCLTENDVVARAESNLDPNIHPRPSSNNPLTMKLPLVIRGQVPRIFVRTHGKQRVRNRGGSSSKCTLRIKKKKG